MSVKVTVPNTSGDYLTFGSANTPDAAKIGGYDDGSSAGHLELYTTTGGTSTERMRIDANGNVGIGTNSPAAKLHISGTLEADGKLTINPSANTTVLDIENPGNRSWFLDTSGNSLTWYSNHDSHTNPILSMASSSTGGSVYVGATSSWNASTFEVNKAVNGNQIVAFANAGNSTPYGLIMKYTAAAPNGTSNEFIYCNDSSALRMSVRSNGGIGNFSANNVNLSDARFKIDITPAKSYLGTICSIPVVTFKYKDQTDDELNLGVIAQDVDAVAPELIDHSGFGEAPEGETPYLAVYQTDLQYALMKAIQELKAELDTVKAELNTLKGTA